jgi:hypothetical protein
MPLGANAIKAMLVNLPKIPGNQYGIVIADILING